MGSVFLWLGSCFDDPPEDEGEDAVTYDPPRPPEPPSHRMFRASRVAVDYSGESETEDTEDCSCHPDSRSSHEGEELSGFRRFWSKLSGWGNPGYESLEVQGDRTTAADGKEKSADEMAKDIACRLGSHSPLRKASTFDETREVPSIAKEEIVMPGSELQKIMARSMSLHLEAQGDECVICLEGFDPTNPRMPTLCGCGENQTYFHLPCLYQWIEKSRNCPSCRKRLRWEEF